MTGNGPLLLVGVKIPEGRQAGDSGGSPHLGQGHLQVKAQGQGGTLGLRSTGPQTGQLGRLWRGTQAQGSYLGWINMAAGVADPQRSLSLSAVTLASFVITSPTQPGCFTRSELTHPPPLRLVPPHSSPFPTVPPHPWCGPGTFSSCIGRDSLSLTGPHTPPQSKPERQDHSV